MYKFKLAVKLPLSEEIIGDTYAVTALAIGKKNGKYLLAGGFGNTASLWDIENKEKVEAFVPEDDESPITSVGLSDDCQYALTGSHCGTIIWWHIEDKENMRSRVLARNIGSNTLALLSPNGKYVVVSCGDNNALLLFSIEDHEHVSCTELACASACQAKLAFSSDSKWIAAASESKQIKLWHIINTDTIFGKTLYGNLRNISSVAFSPDSNYIAVGGISGTYRKDSVELWYIADPKTETAITLNPNKSSDKKCIYGSLFEQVVFSQDNTHLFGVTSRGKILSWDLRALNGEQPE